MGTRQALVLATCLIVAADVAVAAPIELTFSPELLEAGRGSITTLTGTITETGEIRTFLNGDSFTLSVPADDTSFFSTATSLISGVESLTVPILGGTDPLLTGPDIYTGTLDVSGGSPLNVSDVVASHTVAVDVQRVPEPATGSRVFVVAAGWLLFAAAAVVGMRLVRRPFIGESRRRNRKRRRFTRN
jgi:hypothetical protein